MSFNIQDCINPNAYLCYFDPSPLLPSALIKNYLAKIFNLFNKYGSEQNEMNLRVISIREKISKLTETITLNDSFYFEVKFVKDPSF